MMDQMKLDILKKIMEEMRSADAARLMAPKPAAMAVEIEKKPLEEEPEKQGTTLVRDGELASEEKGEDPDDGDMSDEEASIIEKLLSGKEDDDEEDPSKDGEDESLQMMSR